MVYAAWSCMMPFLSCSTVFFDAKLSVSVQSISYRNAMFKPIMADRPGFRMEEIMCDIVHPNALGHRFSLTGNALPIRQPKVHPCSLGHQIHNHAQQLARSAQNEDCRILRNTITIL